MATYTYPMPASAVFNDDLVGAVRDYLTGQGFMVTAVSLESDPVQLRIEANANPSAALDAYAGQPSAERQALRDALTVITAYQGVVATWTGGGTAPTAAQVARGLDALATIVRAMAKRMDIG